MKKIILLLTLTFSYCQANDFDVPTEEQDISTYDYDSYDSASANEEIEERTVDEFEEL
jgi:hypothetical protein